MKSGFKKMKEEIDRIEFLHYYNLGKPKWLK